MNLHACNRAELGELNPSANDIFIVVIFIHYILSCSHHVIEPLKGEIDQKT